MIYTLNYINYFIKNGKKDTSLLLVRSYESLRNKHHDGKKLTVENGKLRNNHVALMFEEREGKGRVTCMHAKL